MVVAAAVGNEGRGRPEVDDLTDLAQMLSEFVKVGVIRDVPDCRAMHRTPLEHVGSRRSKIVPNTEVAPVLIAMGSCAPVYSSQVRSLRCFPRTICSHRVPRERDQTLAEKRATSRAVGAELVCQWNKGTSPSRFHQRSPASRNVKLRTHALLTTNLHLRAPSNSRNEG